MYSLVNVCVCSHLRIQQRGQDTDDPQLPEASRGCLPTVVRRLPLDRLRSDHFSTPTAPDGPRLRLSFMPAPARAGVPMVTPARPLSAPSLRRPAWCGAVGRSFVFAVTRLSLCCRGVSESFQAGTLCSTRLRASSGVSSRRRSAALCTRGREGRILGS